MTSERLGEMFKDYFTDKCAGKFLLVSQRVASQGFKFRDLDCPNPSFNIETETMNLEVSATTPRL
jgi:hypothetical protein